MLGRILRSKKMLFTLVLLVIFLFFSYSLYNINITNRYIDSVLQSNYYQGATLNDYLTQKIDNELGNLVKEKVENNELYSAISFSKSASRSELIVIVFAAFSVVFLVLIGFLVWSSNKQRTRSQEVVDDLENMQQKARASLKSAQKAEESAQKAAEGAGNTAEEIRKMRLTAQRNLVRQIMYRNTAERFSSDNKNK